MQRYQLILEKANILRQRFIDGDYNGYRLAKELRVSTITTWRYKREFEKIRADDLDDTAKWFDISVSISPDQSIGTIHVTASASSPDMRDDMEVRGWLIGAYLNPVATFDKSHSTGSK